MGAFLRQIHRHRERGPRAGPAPGRGRCGAQPAKRRGQRRAPAGDHWPPGHPGRGVCSYRDGRARPCAAPRARRAGDCAIARQRRRRRHPGLSERACAGVRQCGGCAVGQAGAQLRLQRLVGHHPAALWRDHEQPRPGRAPGDARHRARMPARSAGQRHRSAGGHWWRAQYRPAAAAIPLSGKGAIVRCPCPPHGPPGNRPPPLWSDAQWHDHAMPAKNFTPRSARL